MIHSYYRGRCIGRLISFLREYGNVVIAHECIFETENQVYFRGELLATYEWEPYSDVPVFTFYGSSKGALERAQQEKKAYVLSWDFPIPQTRKEFQNLASNDPRRYRELLRWDWMHPAMLSIAAEKAKHLNHIKIELEDLLKHESPLVREGALYGCDGHLSDGDRNFMLIMRVEKLSKEDPNPKVRELAKDLISKCEVMPFPID